jgi:enoyl-CoA hydratase/carnithine racemase
LDAFDWIAKNDKIKVLVIMNCMEQKGGGPFFLGKMLGYGQAKKLLMSEKDINALEALEIGMVDQIVPCDNLEEAAILMAQDLARRSIRSLEGIKRLIN